MSTVVPFKSRGVRAVLREAHEQHIPMRFARERIQPGWIHGFVVGLSREYCLIAEVGDAMRYDGFVVLAISDLSQIEEDPSREFVEKALALRGEPLVVPPDFRLDDWGTIAQSAMRLAPIISVNVVEDDAGEISYIGQLTELESDGLILREVDPNAHWYADTGDYGFDEIASIGFGTGYLDALWQVAGTPADPLKPRAPVSDSLH
ncbi:hypothetical protein ACQQ2N_06575 [Dokdonella sp. MW10]|uniref:hypothetical protein n=1 Tax=Dokdonella sp. MW10 TaxID=2992926 RepID=UPI003F80E04B